MMTVKTETKNGSSEICSDCQLADLLDDYMKFRANKEDAAYTLDPQFFRKAIAKGIWSFFGIIADPDTGTLVEDVRNPAAFKEWKASQSTDGEFTCSYDFVEAVGKPIAAS